ncbi:iron complex transport system permease protein [Clostridium tetanomorphum]|uniref:FecCD family ABC transporter permease n=1 Tax=Clostridium tetanomorphum TaxID=1553 RepID=UPI0004537FFC|nr:iron ABC transporter permease [Clostridium tetanomorphum]KAJ48807.1 iron ABC transporter permease [Clostridium tetanomorphum DSM 665]KAJ52064.1 iron ABC transporter permease [Clostridium tetanomorphum DSM 665]MBP1862984.1 iron complex transport system permease protein [Clostridium tetanomorphum]NRS82813.1 iron complex transport system permease protein [Clostridium tetanomorphum]SQC00066.1 ABC transporter permease [Clostridium tetanomorphum]
MNREKNVIFKPGVRESLMRKWRISRESKINIALFIVLIILIFISLIIGKYPIEPLMLFKSIFATVFTTELNIPEEIYTVIFNIRLPRIFAGVLIGAALSTAGAAYQGMFKNPMVSPDILGASSGAAFGAATGILFSFSVVGIQIISFLFGIIAVVITYIISEKVCRSGDSTLTLILSGMLISTLFSSFVSLIKYVADSYNKLPDITFWLMGSLSAINKKDLYIISLPIIIGIAVIIFVRWKLNIMAFGEEEALAMGVNTKRLRVIVIMASTLIISSSVSISGLIGWVGLIIPHFARILVGPNYKHLIPTSILAGSSYLILVDNMARNLGFGEIPIGILTSIIGAPFFVYLMMNIKRGWV